MTFYLNKARTKAKRQKARNHLQETQTRRNVLFQTQKATTKLLKRAALESLIVIPDWTYNDLLLKSIEAYNSENHEKQNPDGATRESNLKFLERNMLNYARHNLTNYDSIVDHVFKKRRTDAVNEFREYVHDEIVKTYLFLRIAAREFSKERKKALGRELSV